MAASAVPNVLWAERKDTVFLTIEVPDVSVPDVKVEDDGHVTFTGVSDGKTYALDLHLAGPLLGSESKVAVLPRHIVLALTKATPGPHWGKLLAGGGKAPHYVKVDWAKYKDEDEEEAEGKGDPMGGFDMSQLDALQNFGGGAGNFGGDDEGDDDDDDEDEMPALAPQ